MYERKMNGGPGKKPVHGQSGDPRTGDHERKGGYRDYEPGQDDFDEDFNDPEPGFLDDDFDEFGEEDDDYDDDFEDGLFDEDQDELRSEEHGLSRPRMGRVTGRTTRRGAVPAGAVSRARRMRFLSPKAIRRHSPAPGTVPERSGIHGRSRLSVLLNSRGAQGQAKH